MASHIRVRVEGDEFRSVRAAFDYKGLPLEDAARFRARLVAAKSGRAVYQSPRTGNRFTFTVAR